MGWVSHLPLSQFGDLETGHPVSRRLVQTDELLLHPGALQSSEELLDMSGQSDGPESSDMH